MEKQGRLVRHPKRRALGNKKIHKKLHNQNIPSISPFLLVGEKNWLIFGVFAVFELIRFSEVEVGSFRGSAQ